MEKLSRRDTGEEEVEEEEEEKHTAFHAKSFSQT